MNDTSNEQRRPTISFVIPQKDRLDLLSGTLRSIARQRMTSERTLEVLVLTQDDVPEAAGALMHDELDGVTGLRYRCIDARSMGTIAAIRNAGAASTDADLLAFLDADVALAENWVEVLLEELAEQEQRLLVSAVQVPPESPSTIECILTELSGMKAGGEVRFLPGHNLLVRRDAFERVGGFPAHLETCEDYVFADRIHAIGTLYLSVRTRYVHLGEDKTYSVVFRKEIWRGRSNLASVSGRQIGWAEIPSFVVPLIVVFALTLSPIAWLFGAGPSALAALVLGLMPVVAYTARLYLAARGRLDLLDVFGYYLTYFPARGIGMVRGVSDLPFLHRTAVS